LAKHLKLTIKNTQIAEAVNLGGLKDKLAKKKAAGEPSQTATKTAKSKTAKEIPIEEAPKPIKEESTPRRARSKSVFSEGHAPIKEAIQEMPEQAIEKAESKPSTCEELRRKIFGEETEMPLESAKSTIFKETEQDTAETVEATEVTPPDAPKVEHSLKQPVHEEKPKPSSDFVKLGPTGRHVKDMWPPKTIQEKPSPQAVEAEDKAAKAKVKAKGKGFSAPIYTVSDEEMTAKKGPKSSIKEFRDIKPAKKQEARFDARDRQGLRDSEDEHRWRKRRKPARMQQEEIPVVRPTSLKIRTPISIKDLAVEMKLKASQLVSKLFMQGVIVTLNDLLEDETTIQLLGHEFGCEITIDTSEEQRIRITDKSVREEISASPTEELVIRPPIVAFMGHVDHGKTSLIDAIRKSNRAAGEAGAITQHIGAFRCHTDVGDITILDTPGHEAFSAMRARGADVTDIVVLVVAGDEGIRQQTLEAIKHAKTANVTIVVAINKSDKPGFNPDNVYRQLADQELLPEAWGGQTLTINCSALTGAGIKELLEMLALQAEVLELKANPKVRARGTVLESEMHKGMGSVATVLVQNGTLRLGDALVFESLWGRVKTMRDEYGRELQECPPSTPVAITGLSGLPEAGQEFIVVKDEREAREIADERRMIGIRQLAIQKKPLTVESLLQQATPTVKKMLNVILRADVQGSLEALKVALEKIESTKAELNVIFAGVGEISESDIQLAATSKGVVLGFHTKVESHAEPLIKQLNVQVRLHDIIYHAIDDIKAIMTSLLDKIAQETDRGKAIVKALFKSSHAGVIAGCQVTEGTIQRNHHIRVMREGTQIGKAQIASLKRVKEDVREVTKGVECGIVLTRFTDIQENDILEAYEITYITQEL